MTYTDTDVAIVLINRQWSGPDYVCVIYDRSKTTLDTELDKQGYPRQNRKILHLAEGIKDYIINGQKTRIPRNV